MKILFLGNNYLGWQVLKWLKETGREIVGLVIHPEEKRKFTDEIVKTAALPQERVFEAPALQEPETLERIKSLNADVALSVMFGYILKKEFVAFFPRGCFNLHPSYLPYNRGTYPNVWSIVDGTPAGVTLHVVDKGVDTGPIIAQKEVKIDPVDTGESLYHKLEQAGILLFKEAWPRVEKGEYTPIPQDTTAGVFHKKSDVEKIDRIDLDKVYKARDLINFLRARTFPPYKGAYFEVDGQKIYMALKLYSEDGP